MAPWSTETRLVAFLWAALLALWPAFSNSARTVQIAPGDAQAFAKALADYGSTGEDTTVLLPPGRILSVANVTIVDAVPVDPSYRPFSSGVLTIMPAPSNDSNTGPTVLDAGMRSGLFSVGGQPMILTNTAELHLVNLVLINLCDNLLTLNQQGTVSWYTATNINLFPRSRARRSQIITNTTIYLRHADAMVQLWVSITYRNNFPQYYSPRQLSAFAFFSDLARIPAAVFYNGTYKSTADPMDPLLTSLREAGAIMPPRMCTGPNISLPALYDPRAPLWVASDAQAWVTSLRTAVEINAVNGSLQGLPCIVVLTSAANPASLIAVSPLPKLEGLLLLTGVLSNEPNVSDWSAILDFGYSAAPLLPVGATAVLMIQMMTLQCLPTSPLPGSASPSALPLPAFPRSLNTTLISLDAVTLILPDLDYLALVLLALPPAPRRAWNTTVQQHAAALKAGISVFAGAGVSPGYGTVTVPVFTGWGINATRLSLVPENRDVLAAVAATCTPTPPGLEMAAGTRPAGTWTSQQVSTVIACVVSAFVLGGLASALVFWIYLQHRVRRAGKEQPSLVLNGKTEDEDPHTPPRVFHLHAKGSTGNLPSSAPLWPMGDQNTNDPTRIPSADDARQFSHNDLAISLPLPPDTHTQRTRQALPPVAPATARRASAVSLGSVSLPVQQGRALQPHDVEQLVDFYDGVSVMRRDEPSHLVLKLPSGQGVLGGDTAGYAATDNSPGHHPAIFAGLGTEVKAGVRAGQGLRRPSDAQTAADTSPARGLRLGAGPGFEPGAGLRAQGLVEHAWAAEPAGSDLSPRHHAADAGTGTAPESEPGQGPDAGLGPQADSVQRPPEHTWSHAAGGSEPGTTAMAYTAGRDAHPASRTRLAAVVANVSARDSATQTASEAYVSGFTNRRASNGPIQSVSRRLEPREAVDQIMRSFPTDSSTVEVKGILGQGAGGVVYLAMWRGIECALKTMAFETADGPRPGSDEAARERQKKHEQVCLEAAVAARVNHANVISTYFYEIKRIASPKVGVTSGLQIEDNTGQDTHGVQTYKLFLIQELCATSLSQALQGSVLHENGVVREAWVVMHLMLDIARGLQYLHSLNIVHGDLKPDNVLLKLCSKSPVGVVCKLADFGLSARLPGNATHLSRYTKGTPFYVAPEVVTEHRTSTASDIFSFGVLMWQLYTCQTPYVVHRGGKMTWNDAFGKLPASTNPPPLLCQTLHRCLLKEPRRRPTATELVGAFEQLVLITLATAKHHVPNAETEQPPTRPQLC